MNLTQVMLAEGAMDPDTALVFCGGGHATAPIPTAERPLIVAADGGVIEAQRHGYRVDLLVGDLDSAPDAAVEHIRREGGRIERFPQDKDSTDLELAVMAAAAAGVGRIVVVGGALGRLDHLLGNTVVLASVRFASIQIDAVLGPALLHVVRDRRDLVGVPDELLSLFAMGGVARGVTTAGLRWKLEGEDLEPGSSRGISNRFVEHDASVAVADGVVLVVRPGGDGP